MRNKRRLGRPNIFYEGWKSNQTDTWDYVILHEWNEAYRKQKRQEIDERSKLLQFKNYKIPRASCPKSYKSANIHYTQAKKGMQIFSAAFGIGKLLSTLKTSQKIEIAFVVGVAKLTYDQFRELFDCGMLYFVEKGSGGKENKRRKIKTRNQEIFEMVNFVDPDKFIPSRLMIGQEIVNPKMKIGEVIGFQDEFCIIRYGGEYPKIKKYLFPNAFKNGDVRLWGGYKGVSYTKKGLDMIEKRKLKILEELHAIGTKEKVGKANI